VLLSVLQQGFAYCCFPPRGLHYNKRWLAPPFLEAVKINQFADPFTAHAPRITQTYEQNGQLSVALCAWVKFSSKYYSVNASLLWYCSGINANNPIDDNGTCDRFYGASEHCPGLMLPCEKPAKFLYQYKVGPHLTRRGRACRWHARSIYKHRYKAQLTPLESVEEVKNSQHQEETLLTAV